MRGGDERMRENGRDAVKADGRSYACLVKDVKNAVNVEEMELE